MDDSTEIQLEVGYLLYLPPGYEDSDGNWPTIVFLHGSGERGSDLERVKVHGPPKLIERGEQLPFIVVAPQCPELHYWGSEWLSPLLDEVCRENRVDADHIYLTGISMGGYGTWQWACAEPQRFAAIAPICGGGRPQNASAIKDLPVWAFHGAKDDIVPLAESTAMVEALRACGGDVRFTVYPEAGHDSWTETYENPELLEWFLARKRGKATKP